MSGAGRGSIHGEKYKDETDRQTGADKNSGEVSNLRYLIFSKVMVPFEER